MLCPSLNGLMSGLKGDSTFKGWRDKLGVLPYLIRYATKAISCQVWSYCDYFRYGELIAHSETTPPLH